MFTGIIQCQATVTKCVTHQGLLKLTLSAPREYLENLATGASIAINGCCLTVVDFTVNEQATGQIHFDVIDETLALTNLGQLTLGSHVNFERSMTFGTELGGHIVSGHIHTTGKVLARITDQDNCKLHISLPQKWQEYLLYKGFVSVNGASLTVGELTSQGFWLHLIPETLAITNLGEAQTGDLLNIEVDQQTYTIVHTVKRYLAAKNE